jgi:hypothetical protein
MPLKAIDVNTALASHSMCQLPDQACMTCSAWYTCAAVYGSAPSVNMCYNTSCTQMVSRLYSSWLHTVERQTVCSAGDQESKRGMLLPQQHGCWPGKTLLHNTKTLRRSCRSDVHTLVQFLHVGFMQAESNHACRAAAAVIGGSLPDAADASCQSLSLTVDEKLDLKTRAVHPFRLVLMPEAPARCISERRALSSAWATAGVQRPDETTLITNVYLAKLGFSVELSRGVAAATRSSANTRTCAIAHVLTD